MQRSVAIATDPSQPEAERLKHLKLVFFAPGNDPKPWLTGFHADVRAAEIIARDATPQGEYWAAGTAPLLDMQGADDPYRPPSSSGELVKEFGSAARLGSGDPTFRPRPHRGTTARGSRRHPQIRQDPAESATPVISVTDDFDAPTALHVLNSPLAARRHLN